jgi:WD40 repeat protein
MKAISGSIAGMSINLNKYAFCSVWTTVLVTLLFSFPAPSTGDSFSIVDTKEMSLSHQALDLAVSPDGRWTFVLTEGGEVAVYGISGNLVQVLKVDKEFNRMEYSPAGNKLLLSSSDKQKLSILTLSLLYELDYSGSPFKGPVDAQVTIAVFDDFQ